MIKHFDPNKHTLTVRFKGDLETLAQFRESLFELIRNYDYKEYARGLIDGDTLGCTLYYAVDFLEHITNEIERLKESEPTQLDTGFIDIDFECLEASELNLTIRAILDLIKGYRYSDFGGIAESIIFKTIDLLHNLLPDNDQFEAAFKETGNYYVIPEKLNQETDTAIRGLLATYRNENSGFNRRKILESLLKSA